MIEFADLSPQAQALALLADRLIGDAVGRPLPTALHVDQVAKVVKVGRGSAYEAVRSGALPSFRIGRHVRVPTLAVVALLLGEPEARAGEVVPFPTTPAPPAPAA